jgi:hypothetical protein
MTAAEPPTFDSRLTALDRGLRELTDEVVEVRSSGRADVDHLAEQVGGLRTRLEEVWVLNPDDETQRQGLIVELSDVVSRLAGQVEALLADPPAQRYRVPCWSEMTAEEAAVAWNDLVTWVRGVLLVTYPVANELPACWYRHQVAVEELSWLRQTWRAAYLIPSAPPKDAGDWHDRWLPGVLQRLGKYVPCGETHLDEDYRGWRKQHPFLRDDQNAELDRYICADLARRPREVPRPHAA